MARKRRSGEVFSMSFLDCMSCGFGAVVLFFLGLFPFIVRLPQYLPSLQ